MFSPPRFGGGTWRKDEEVRMRVSRAVFSSIALAVSAALSGCGSGEPKTSSQPSPPAQIEAEKGATTVSLVGSDWHVADIGGHAVVDSSQTSMTFAAEGNVSGSTGCNHFTGTAKIEDDRVSFSPLATTRKACAGELATQEQTFLKAIESVHRFAIDESGQLLLEGADGQTLMRLTRATP
jgi:heat shock protein HslJ